MAIQEGINNPSLIYSWVNRFRAAGPDALKPRKKGRKRNLYKPKKDIKVTETEKTLKTYIDQQVQEQLQIG